MAYNCLQEKLDSHGLSQVELSKSADLSTGTINKVCTRARTPAPRTRTKIVMGLNRLANTDYQVGDIFTPSQRVKGEDV